MNIYHFKFYNNLALRPPYVRSVLFVSYLNYEFSMTTCMIAHSTVPSTRISRELALTIGASPSPLTAGMQRYYCRLTLVIAVGHSTPPNTLYINLVVVLCMGMSL